MVQSPDVSRLFSLSHSVCRFGFGRCQHRSGKTDAMSCHLYIRMFFFPPVIYTPYYSNDMLLQCQCIHTAISASAPVSCYNLVTFFICYWKLYRHLFHLVSHFQMLFTDVYSLIRSDIQLPCSLLKHNIIISFSIHLIFLSHEHTKIHCWGCCWWWMWSDRKKLQQKQQR